MARLPHECATISVCLAGALLLLPLCWGFTEYQYDLDYDSTEFQEYNSTFDIGFYSNISSEVLEKFLLGGETDTGEDTNTTASDGNVLEEKPTEPTFSIMNQASRSAPVCSILITLIMMAHQVLWLL